MTVKVIVEQVQIVDPLKLDVDDVPGFVSVLKQGFNVRDDKPIELSTKEHQDIIWGMVVSNMGKKRRAFELLRQQIRRLGRVRVRVEVDEDEPDEGPAK